MSDQGPLIAFFGGSFNPVTEGHLSLIEAFRKKYPWCLLVIVPTTQNPWKKDSPVSQFHRIQMIVRALEYERIAHRVIDVSREEHQKQMELLLHGDTGWTEDVGEVWVVNERYILMADLIYRWCAEIMNCYEELGDKLGIVVATDGAHTVENWVNWSQIKPLVELIEMPIIINVHSTDVREGRHPLHPAISRYFQMHLKGAYPKAIPSATPFALDKDVVARYLRRFRGLFR